MPNSPTDNIVTADEAVLAAIRRLLLTGELKPGESIRQAALAKQLGVSRVPVREALAALEAVGQVQRVHHSGFVVTRLTFQEFEEIYRVRDLLEDDAIRQVFRRGISQQTIWRMRQAHEEESQLTVQDIVEVTRVNRLFHFPLFEAASVHQFRLIRQLWDITDHYRVLYYSVDEHFEAGLAEHSAILEAVIDGDEERTIELSRHHRQQGVTSLAPILS